MSGILQLDASTFGRIISAWARKQSWTSRLPKPSCHHLQRWRVPCRSAQLQWDVEGLDSIWQQRVSSASFERILRSLILTSSSNIQLWECGTLSGSRAHTADYITQGDSGSPYVKRQRCCLIRRSSRRCQVSAPHKANWAPTVTVFSWIFGE